MNDEPEGNGMPGHPKTRIFNFPACSGATTDAVLENQFRDTFYWDPIWGSRPPFGDAQIATLSVGGNDVDILGLVRNCILEIFPSRSCEDQVKYSWDLIRDEVLPLKIGQVIEKTLQKGRAGNAKENFRLYVLGYADFFNVDTDQCDTISFARRPRKDGSSVKMTKDLRIKFNNMANDLNAAIAKAAQNYTSQGVKYIEWQANGALDGHRFCEEGVQEPDGDRTDTWFFYYPYKKPKQEEDALDNLIANIWDPTVNTYVNFEKKYGDHPPAMPQDIQDTWDMWGTLYDKSSNNSDLGPEWLSERVRTLHPTTPGHKLIKQVILRELEKDVPLSADTPQSPEAPPTVAPPPPAVGQCNDHYKFVLDTFSIEGANWDESKFRNGDGLLKELRGCGVVTKLKFDPNFHDDKNPSFKWKATGELPIATKNCVQRAIVSAGGDHESCHGST